MAPDLIAKIQNALPLLVMLIALFVLLGFASRQSTRRSRYWRSPSSVSDRRPLADPAHQLNAVMEAGFTRQRVLSQTEYRAFRIVEEDVAAMRKGYRVFAQTSLGEILRSPSDDAYYSINSKRVDILVVNRGGWPVLAVEHQGSGHYQGSAAARDAVKKEALRRAGVEYVEVFPGDSDEQIRFRIREKLDRQGDVRLKPDGTNEILTTVPAIGGSLEEARPPT